MAATATAPRTRTRRKRAAAPARPRPKARAQRRGITPATGFAIPAAAVGKTAVAVGGLADSGLVIRLTRSRAWIGLIGALLVGIVGLNVYKLSLSASGSQVAQKAEELALENSTLRAQLTERLSNEEIQKAASGLGLGNPEPNDISYLKTSPGDAKAAAKRLLGGELGAEAAAEPAPAEEAAPVETAPVAPAPVEPVAPAPAPVETAPAVPVEPAAVAPAPVTP